MIDGRLNLFGGRLNAQKINQVAYDFLGISGQLCKFDFEDGNVGMRLDEVVAMFEEAWGDSFR